MIVTSSVWETCSTLGVLLFAWQKNYSVGCTKSKDRILLADLVCFEVLCLPRSAHLKIFLILAFWWRRFKSAYLFLTKKKGVPQLLLVCLLLCFLLLLLLSVYFSCIWRRQFYVQSACIVFPCVTSYRWIHFPSSVLSVLSTSPVVVHSFLRKRLYIYYFFHIHEITRVVVLYTSLRFVEGVYKPQWACAGCASVTESCLEACIPKRTCLDEFSPGHP